MAHPGESLDALVIGVDFGTTFSGIAATYGANPEAPDDINVIKTWPGGHGITSEKVPSEIAYSSMSSTESVDHRTSARPVKARISLNGRRSPTVADPLSFCAPNGVFGAQSGESASQCPRWGFQVEPNERYIRCMKLLLDPRQQLPDYVSLHDIQAQLTASGKDVQAVVADYLTALYKHAKEMLTRRYGEHFVKNTEFRVVLTVPAVWSDAAKHATLKAAEAAGIGDSITMISEPEAAAVYTLQAIQRNYFKAGDNFVVVDAGGGTVDLISYEIRQLTPLRIEESVTGSGACCGAVLLNVRFEERIRARLGTGLLNRIRTSKPKAWLTALKYFEDYVKRNFDPSEDSTFSIPFPGIAHNEDAGIEQGFLFVTSAEVGDLFRPIIAEIVELIEGQISKLRALKSRSTDSFLWEDLVSPNAS